MLEIIKDPTFAERNIPLGILEVTYPDRSAWDITKFYDLVHAELDALREKYADYDRKAVFGENPYFRFFKKFKKTYPVMQQFESVLFKGRPFPEEDPVMGVPFLLELTTGLRRGELLALLWTDLDVENMTISVSKQVNRINGDGGQPAQDP